MPRKRSTPNPRPRTGLTREQILSVALEVLDRDGLEALSMRRIATELGVGTMTVYSYFRDKDELLDGVIDAGAQQLGATVPDAPWKESLRALAFELHHELAQHSFIAQLRQRRPILSPGALRWTEAVLEVLHRAGFSADEAPQALRPLFLYTFAYTAFSPDEATDSARRASLAASVSLPPEQYPRIVQSAHALADSMTGETTFAYGLDRLLDGLEAQLKRQQED
jgi:AcrR family transcriptional regulator